MTSMYEWNPMPYKVAINCPCCGNHALFEFAEIVQIKLKKDIEHFKMSDQFDYHFFQDQSGQRWHAAVFYPGLHGGSTKSISSLPDGYAPYFWNHSKYLTEHHDTPWGSFICTSCNKTGKHVIQWPEDAFYSVSHKGQNLWAFDRESAVELRDFIQSKSRNENDFRWTRFLRHIPTVFKHQKNRDRIVKQIDKLLAS